MVRVAESLGLAGRVRGQEYFSLPSMVQRTLALYEEMVTETCVENWFPFTGSTQILALKV